MDDNHVLKLTAAQLDDALNKALNALPRDGSAPMTGTLHLSKTVSDVACVSQEKIDSISGGPIRAIDFYKNGSWVSRFAVGESDLKYWAKALNAYNTILHTGNKPSGYYTGNGSAASRTIAIGGIGNVIAIFAVNCFAVITPYGGIMVNTEVGTIKNVSSGDTKYENGVLTIANDIDYLNYNGATYYYQVL